MAHTCDTDTIMRRIRAYTDFLMDAYDTDEDGLADLAGVDRGEMASFMLETDYDKLSVVILVQLEHLTGIRFSWLFAEQAL